MSTEPRTVSLGQVLAAATRATAQVATWPEWKQRLANPRIIYKPCRDLSHGDVLDGGRIMILDLGEETTCLAADHKPCFYAKVAINGLRMGMTLFADDTYGVEAR